MNRQTLNLNHLLNETNQTKPQVVHPELQDAVVNIATKQVTTVDVTDLDQALAEQACHGLNQ